MNSPQLLGSQLCPWLVETADVFERTARDGRLSHAWLITGPQGVGKSNLARCLGERLASAVPPDRWAVLSPTDAASAMTDRYSHYDHAPDLHLVFPEEGKQSISVEQVREVATTLSLKGHGIGSKVVVIEPADSMTVAASNALLKTLEEPTPSTYLFLVCERPSVLPATIRSRCQKMPIRLPSRIAVKEWLDLADVDSGRLARLSTMSYQGPLAYLDLLIGTDTDDLDQYEKSMEGLATTRLDPFVLAANWVKLDLRRILGWLVREIQLTIRERMSASRSNHVTALSGKDLHNNWSKLTLEALFLQLDRAEKILDQVGTGANVELSLQVLLLGFTANRI